MYYRRKILHSLIETFGGSLTKTDCLKLLFLFCQYREKNYYDFFPYKYGGFSVIAYQDKEIMEKSGFLQSHENFLLNPKFSFQEQLLAEDRSILSEMAVTFRKTRGKNLLRQVYLEFPYYASRSQILSEVLKPKEIKKTMAMIPQDFSSCLFSLGYEGLTIDFYLNKVISHNISAIVDVRKNPLSRKFGFSKTKFQEYLNKIGISYFHLPDLGIPSNLRKNLQDPESYLQLFRHYQKSVLPRQKETLEELKGYCNQYNRIGVTCFEADHNFCHRKKIVEHLEKTPDFNPEFIHI